METNIPYELSDRQEAGGSERLAVYRGQNTYSDSAGVTGDSGLSHRPVAPDVEPIDSTFTVNAGAGG